MGMELFPLGKFIAHTYLCDVQSAAHSFPKDSLPEGKILEAPIWLSPSRYPSDSIYKLSVDYSREVR